MTSFVMFFENARKLVFAFETVVLATMIRTDTGTKNFTLLHTLTVRTRLSVTLFIQ